MTKVAAIIQPSRLEAVKEVLMEIGVEGMTISDVRGHGRQKGHTDTTGEGNTQSTFCRKSSWKWRCPTSGWKSQ